MIENVGTAGFECDRHVLPTPGGKAKRQGTRKNTRRGDVGRKRKRQQERIEEEEMWEEQE